MTACATEGIAADSRTARHSTFTIAADGAYAARLNASADGGWYPERWTLDGPEPYAVPLPGDRPEEAGSQVLPLTDGRVLIARRERGRHQLALLYPTGPGTGELPLGTVESELLTLLPPAPCGQRAYALTPGEHSTGVWLVAGSGDGGPQLVAQVPGRCSGGAWLDREGRLLAVDRTDTAGSGRTKTVAVDLARSGEVTPLLQITDDSDDRLLLADVDSGLLIVRSDAPGESRLGWGVLGSHRPVRFPESLHPEGALLTPFAVQPGQMLLPESCAVALHGQTTGARAGGAWLGVWRPMQKELRRFRSPGGWLPGKGVWTREGELRLPCATAHVPCGLARLRMRGRAPAEPGTTVAGTGTGTAVQSETGQEAGPAPGAGSRTEPGPDAGGGPRPGSDVEEAPSGTPAGDATGSADSGERPGADGLTATRPLVTECPVPEPDPHADGTPLEAAPPRPADPDGYGTDPRTEPENRAEEGGAGMPGTVSAAPYGQGPAEAPRARVASATASTAGHAASLQVPFDGAPLAQGPDTAEHGGHSTGPEPLPTPAAGAGPPERAASAVPQRPGADRVAGTDGRGHRRPLARPQPRTPVPLQDAPLPTAHDEALPSRTG